MCVVTLFQKRPYSCAICSTCFVLARTHFFHIEKTKSLALPSSNQIWQWKIHDWSMIFPGKNLHLHGIPQLAMLDYRRVCREGLLPQEHAPNPLWRHEVVQTVSIPTGHQPNQWEFKISKSESWCRCPGIPHPQVRSRYPEKTTVRLWYFSQLR